MKGELHLLDANQTRGKKTAGRIKRTVKRSL